jgi:hypothetical protein
MAGSTTRTPRFRDIAIGVAAVAVLLVALINLGAVVKFAGNGLMVIPSLLGIVHRVGAEEISTYDLAVSPTVMGISQPGRYDVYAYDYDLLTMSDQIEASRAAPWITIRSEVTEQPVPVEFVGRNLKPYDTYLAKGRPVLSFVIPQPGVYVMTHSTKRSSISVVRDYVTGNERTIDLAFAVQIGLVAIPVVVLFARRYLARREALRKSQRETRQRAEAFWQREVDGPEVWRRPK